MARRTGRAEPATMTDVARAAGVSQMTVSRVMRGTGYVSQPVRDSVMGAARDIGYVHNRLAGAQSTYDNPLIGVVVPTLHNRVFTEVLSGISERLTAHGLRPVFGVSEYRPDLEEAVALDLMSWRPRGLILAGVDHTDGLRAMIARSGVRTAEIMDSDGDAIDAAFGISHTDAGASMARHLIERGYRRIALVASLGGLDLRATRRLDAARAVFASEGVDVLASRLSSGPSSMEAGRRMTEALMERSDAPDAIYFANDDLAAGGLMHCLANGIDTPGTVALAGFNGLGFLDALPRRITTTVTPRYEIGVAAADWVAGSTQIGTAFEAELRIGDTT